MKKILISIMFLFTCANLQGLEMKPKDASALFYKANSYYESGEFSKAIDSYNEVLGQGLEGGNLYYNIANAHFKLGDLGRAVLYYEKAKKFIPQDADLKSNLEYSASLIEEPLGGGQKAQVMRFVCGLTEQFAIDSLAVFVSAAWFLLLSAAILNILYGARARKALVIPIGALGLVFAAAGASLSARVYEKEFLKPAVVISKEAICAFEPFERSTTYFKMHAGEKVFVLSSNKGWSKIQRTDGKAGWVRNDAIGII